MPCRLVPSPREAFFFVLFPFGLPYRSEKLVFCTSRDVRGPLPPHSLFHRLLCHRSLPPINMQGEKGGIHFSTFFSFDGSITSARSPSSSRVLERHIQVGLLFPFPSVRIPSSSPCSPPRQQRCRHSKHRLPPPFYYKRRILFLPTGLDRPGPELAVVAGSSIRGCQRRGHAPDPPRIPQAGKEATPWA